MCNDACINFVASTVVASEVVGKKVIESGAREVNGSVRPIFERLGCALYVGTDLVAGPRVDVICDAVNLVDVFGAGSFDIVVSTEVIEHVRDWRAVITNYKRLLRPGGLIFITTRSKGFPYHGYPEDHWRYEGDDMLHIFADFEILNINNDPSESSPGVFMKARRSQRKSYKATNLKKISLYSIDIDARELIKSTSIK